MKNYELKTQKQLLSLVLDAINDGRVQEGDEVSEIHNEVFNTDYFIIGRYEAEQWLIANCGVFNAIGIVSEYENENFGEITTDLSEAERVCNMLTYIWGEDVLNSLTAISDNHGERVTDEILEAIKEEIEELINA